MPPKGSNAKRAKQNYLGIIQSDKKKLYLMENKLAAQKQLLAQCEAQLKEISKEINIKSRKLLHKRSKLENVKNKTISFENQIKRKCIKNDVKISSRLAKKRKLQPTTNEMNVKSKSIRRTETMNACFAIHGASKENLQPAITGMLDTLNAKCNVKQLSRSIMSSKSSLTNALKVEISDKWSKEYYSSKENTLRSLNTYYSHNVLGKRKYLSIRKANQRACYKKQSVPNYVPYNKLAMHINQVDIDTLLPISDLVEVNNNETFTGAYRNPAQYILRLAKFYLFVNKNRHDKLKVFPYFKKKNEDSFLFCVSIGGDGAPICGMSILVSFLNVGSRIASSDEQFLLFGADVSENSIIVSKFIEKLVVDMKYLEKETFSIDIEGDFVQVEFAFSELPNDMKMKYHFDCRF